MNKEITISAATQAVFEAHEFAMDVHSKALACHCECLGMNAENTYAACLGKPIVYNDDSYIAAMKKWGLIGESGEPIIT